MRSFFATLRQLIIPAGAQPGIPRIVIGGDIPPELVTYYGVFSFTVYAAILYQFDADDYQYDALVNQTPGVNPQIVRGAVIAGVVQGSTLAVGQIGAVALVTVGVTSGGRLSVGTALFPDALLEVWGQTQLRDTTAGTVVLDAAVSGDGNARRRITAGGVDEWGSGAAAPDTNLYRGAASVLKTDDSLHAPAMATVVANTGTDDLGFTQTTFSTNQTCGLVFTAPPSGVVLILWRARFESNTAAVRVFVSMAVRTGNTIGSGTVVLAANDGRAIEASSNTDRVQMGTFNYATGLTAGSQYNAQIEYKMSAAGNGDIFDQEITAIPMIG